jgi:hypothetical protein
MVIVMSVPDKAARQSNMQTWVKRICSKQSLAHEMVSSYYNQHILLGGLSGPWRPCGFWGTDLF